MLEEVLALAKSSEKFRVISEELDRTGEAAVSGLFTSSSALLLAYLFEELELPLLVLTESVEEAEQLKEDLSQFLPQVHWLPPPEGDVEGTESRMMSLSALLLGEVAVLVLPTQSLLAGVPQAQELGKSIIDVTAGCEMDLEAFLGGLYDGGYERVGTVEVVGELALRGGIVDCYPFGFENPLRVEFAGDRISSLREFDSLTQRSVAHLKGVRILPFREPGGLKV